MSDEQFVIGDCWLDMNEWRPEKELAYRKQTKKPPSPKTDGLRFQAQPCLRGSSAAIASALDDVHPERGLSSWPIHYSILSGLVGWKWVELRPPIGCLLF